MTGWAITFLIVALLAALVGMGGIAPVSLVTAQFLFFVFATLFVVAVALWHRQEGDRRRQAQMVRTAAKRASPVGRSGS